MIWEADHTDSSMGFLRLPIEQWLRIRIAAFGGPIPPWNLHMELLPMSSHPWRVGAFKIFNRLVILLTVTSMFPEEYKS